jgi:hypothetical protein
MAKVKIIKNERDPPLFTGKLVIKFQNTQADFSRQSRKKIANCDIGDRQRDPWFTGEERRIPFFFDDFHFCRSRVIGLDMTENRISCVP